MATRDGHLYVPHGYTRLDLGGTVLCSPEGVVVLRSKAGAIDTTTTITGPDPNTALQKLEKWILDACFWRHPKAAPIATCCVAAEACPLDGVTHAVHPKVLAKSVFEGLSPASVHSLEKTGVPDQEAMELLASDAAGRVTDHPDYGMVAGRFLMQLWSREVAPTFCEAVRRMRQHRHRPNKPAPLISRAIEKAVETHGNLIEKEIAKCPQHPNLTYEALRILRRSYLLTGHDGTLYETPAYMWMRVALGIHGTEFNLMPAFETFWMMANMEATHASPTLMNAGTPRPQMASCFLLTAKADSIEGIFETAKRAALVSKNGGGIGISITHLRAKGSYVGGTNGKSNGVGAWCQVFGSTAKSVDQGGGKRKGAATIYLEPWHADVEDFIRLKCPSTKASDRADALFYGLWVPDLFMERVLANKGWSLFCPADTMCCTRCMDKAPCCGKGDGSDCTPSKPLYDMWGKEFEEWYLKLEVAGKARKVISAAGLLMQVADIRMETGQPYILSKDACNRKNNQCNLGTIRGSNLCTEIIEYTAEDEVAVCNLASICLPQCVAELGKGEQPHPLMDSETWVTKGKGWLGDPKRPTVFDHDKLFRVVQSLVRNLNKVIDKSYYPLNGADRKSNERHRPIGLGVQGYADTLAMLGFEWASPEARQLNLEIFETMYFAALDASQLIAKEKGGPYSSFKGSPASQGKLQMDLWEAEGRLPKAWEGKVPLTSKRFGWDSLRHRIQECGLANSLLVAPMPTASTGKIMGNTASCQPFSSMVRTIKLLSGDVMVVNRLLVDELARRGLWSAKARDAIIYAGGVPGKCDASVIPEDLQRLFRTGWELTLREQIDPVADRGPFVDQSQSFNWFMSSNSSELVFQGMIYAYRRGLKTWGYYNYSMLESIGQAIATVGSRSADQAKQEAAACSRQDPDCLSCGS